MDLERFDSLTRRLARRESRRRAIRTLFAGGTGLTAVIAGSAGVGAAKKIKPDCCPESTPRLCNLTCTDTTGDPANCGDCGIPCTAFQTCTSGVCVGNPQCSVASTCPGTDTECQTRTCSGGICGVQYAPLGTPVANQTPGDCKKNVCDGAGNVISVNDDTDVPASGSQCLIGTCSAGVPGTVPREVGTFCSQGTFGRYCDGAGNCVQCVEPSDCPERPNSTNNCGGGGICSITCNSGFTSCNASVEDGCETNIGSDVNNCGGCGFVCSTNNATPMCQFGFCTSICNPGFGNCDGFAVNNGCETAFSTDVNNCGGCGIVCSAPNGTPLCDAGACSIASCDPGFADCDETAPGCETNTDNDSNNCGGCGVPCGDGQTCSEGVCV